MPYIEGLSLSALEMQQQVLEEVARMNAEAEVTKQEVVGIHTTVSETHNEPTDVSI